MIDFTLETMGLKDTEIKSSECQRKMWGKDSASIRILSTRKKKKKKI